MSNQWEQYVEPAAEAMWESFRPGVWPRGDGVLEPIPAWADCAETERESCRGEVRAALAVVGPKIVEDTKQRLVEAAARAIVRETVEDQHGERAEAPAPSAEQPLIVCEPAKDCKDPHIHRWHCMRGHAVDGEDAVPGVCLLKVCEQRGANR